MNVFYKDHYPNAISPFTNEYTIAVSKPTKKMATDKSNIF
ncbi:MAG: hypothetical protein ACI9YE_003146, partial [Psychroserpens sp.]